MRIRVLLAILVFSFSACATGPTKQFVRTGPSHDVRITNLRNVAIIADVCLLRDVSVGDKYWSIKDSRASAQYMTESAKTYLATKGYDVVFVEAPFVGSFISANVSLKFAAEEDAQLGEMHPPLYVEGLASDPIYRQPLITTISGSFKAVAQRAKPPSDICCTGANVKGALDVVSKRTGADAILFLVGQGVIVPEGKSAVQGIATGVLTTVLTLGMFTYSQWSVSYLDTYAALVDAETGEILWSNSLRLKGGGFTDRDYYSSEKWPHSILYHMPSRTNSKAN